MMKNLRSLKTLLGVMIIFSLFACQSTIPVKDAQEIVVKYHDTINRVPPRGLGADINFYVERYRNYIPQSYTDNSPSPLDSMPTVAYKPTKERIESLAYGRHGPWNMQEQGRINFYQGNIDDAIIWINAAVKKAEWKMTKADCLFDKARFQAEGGNFIKSKRTLANAKRIFSNYNNRKRKEKKRWLLKREYLNSNGTAAVKYAMGDMKSAEKYYKKALEALTTAENSNISFGYSGFRRQYHLIADLKIGISKSLLWQGKIIEAEVYAREALSSHGGLALPSVLMTLSQIFYEQGRYDEAEMVALSTVNMIINNEVPNSQISEDSVVRAKARDVLANVYMTKGKWKEALKVYNKIYHEMESNSHTYQRLFDGNRNLGFALLMTGNPGDGRQQLSRAKENLIKRYGYNHYVVYEVMGLMAMAEFALGNKKKALDMFDSTVPKLMEKWRDHSGNNTGFYSRLQRLEYIIENYIRLLIDTSAPGNIKTAFSMASAFQTRTLGRAIAASSVRSVVKDPQLAELIRNRQDIDMQLAAYQNRLVTAIQASSEVRNKKAIKKLIAERDELKQALESLNKEIEQQFPDYSKFYTQSVESVEEVTRQLKEDEALLSMFTGSKATYVWVVQKGKEPVVHVCPMGKNDLKKKIKNLRKSLEPESLNTLADIPKFDIETAYSLYANLLKPLEKAWKSSKTLLVVCNSPLDQLPLSLLPNKNMSLKYKSKLHFEEYRKVPWLARTHAVTMLPSITSFIQLRTSNQTKKIQKLYAGFGDPWFSESKPEHVASSNQNQQAVYRRAKPNTRQLESADLSRLPRLPETAIEVKSIATALGADPINDVFIGNRATETQVKQMDLSDRSVLVFATHGLIPGDLDGLHQPALALSSPSVIGEKENDGLLTMGEIMWLRLNADWVVLSACNTASGDGVGAEAVSGLGQAFFYAGAKTLLVTSWPVETTSAMTLTTDLFRRQAKNSKIGRAEALRQAKLALIDDIEGEGFSYAHPLFWAPFIVVGEGGGETGN